MPTSSLSPSPFSLSTSSSSSSCSSTCLPTFCNSTVSCVSASRIRKPTTLNCKKVRSLQFGRFKMSSESRIGRVRSSIEQPFIEASSCITSEEDKEGEEEENSPTSPEQEKNSRPRRIALFVEPSPFSYIPRYTFSWLVKPMWLVLKFLHRAADLTLVPSVAIANDLEEARVTAANRIRLWNKGVDSESFNSRFRSHEMRLRLSNGEPERPLIVHVGRLGVEKNLDFLKRVMDKLPEARIAFIGDGPYKPELEQMFEGMPAIFTGMLQGEELSQAYASGDIFVMPSESETLGFVVLEAMSSGLPVVVARAGGIPDIILEEQQGKTGYLYNPGDLDDFLSKLEPLLHDRELRETIGKAARAEMEKYDWRAAAKKVRNEQYNAAIWFCRKKRAQFLRPLQWWFRRAFWPSAL